MGKQERKKEPVSAVVKESGFEKHNSLFDLVELLMALGQILRKSNPEKIPRPNHPDILYSTVNRMNTQINSLESKVKGKSLSIFIDVSLESNIIELPCSRC